MSEAMFAHLADKRAAVNCPHCGNHHEFDVKQALLKRDADPLRPASKRSKHPYLRRQPRRARQDRD